MPMNGRVRGWRGSVALVEARLYASFIHDRRRIPPRASIPMTASRRPPFRTPLVATASLALALAACGRARLENPSAVAEHWVGTWATAPQLTEPANLPPAPGLAGNTLRQIVRVSLGGERLRARFSNEFGTAPVTLNAAHVAVATGGGAIEPATDRPLTFAGRPSVTIPAGAAVMSDPFPFALRPLSTVAITLRFGDVPTTVTGHPGSRTTSYLQAGDAVSAADLPDAARTDHWYIATGLDVVAGASAAAVVTLGNSITDGRGSGTNKQNRWPDELANRLGANAGTADVAVLNQGIGGNCVLRACLGPAAVARFDRDVLGRSGVRWLIVLEGVNDIGQAAGAAGSEAVARDLIAAYGAMIDRAHARGIHVYGATILPFGGSFYDSPEHEAARQTVNAWIRTSGRFDAVIDLDAALRDPANPSRLLPAADTGDHLHPNETGHRMIAEAVDLALFERSAPRR
jgi:lysophospholipase L1-like esterase